MSLNVLYIDSFNLKSSGGIKLLNLIISKLKIINIEFRLVTNQENLLVLHNSIYVDNLIERDLFLYSKANVLFLSNIPPIISSRNSDNWIFYLHQRYWVDKTGFHFIKKTKQKFYLILKYSYFHLFKRNIKNYVVQTSTMKSLAKNLLPSIEVFPIFDNFDCDYILPKRNLCLIIGDDTPHKAISSTHPLIGWFHRNQVDYTWVGYSNRYNYDGSLSTFLSFSEVERLLQLAKFVFLPSSFESFGFPFIEACSYRCSIIVESNNDIAKELLLNYYEVDDVLKMSIKTFNPTESKIKIKDKSDDFILYLQNKIT